MLLSRWALDAQPEDLLVASQPDTIRKVPVLCIALVIPLCQQDRVLCNGWVLDLLRSSCSFSALRAARFGFTDSGRDFGTPLMATGITVPMSWLIALCHHTVRCAIICLIVPLCRHQRSLGSQRVVLAHFAAAALRTTTASGSVIYRRFPSVQVAIWALITYPPHLLGVVRLDVNGAQVSIGSMVPLLLKSWIKAADIRTFLLYSLAVA